MKRNILSLLQHIWTDLSAWALILTNLITISFAFMNHWAFSTIIWVYWCQTLIIGLFAFLRVVRLTDISHHGVERIQPKMYNRLKLRNSALFIAHFTVVQGCLTFILGAFLGPVTNQNGTILLSSSLLFFCNHLFSYYYNRKKDSPVRKNIGIMVVRPYLRLLPLFVAFLFIGMFVAAFFLVRDQQLAPAAYVVLFVLKTGADVIAHMLEHRIPTIKKRRWLR
ncbi:MAG TPA: DUF6498-containing protein [Candidatus Thermoplasmatota archaeon]|nr:DUF6498-containing protein [Candidatus Thermoplasmatota archaeon]